MSGRCALQQRRTHFLIPSVSHDKDNRESRAAHLKVAHGRHPASHVSYLRYLHTIITRGVRFLAKLISILLSHSSLLSFVSCLFVLKKKKFKKDSKEGNQTRLKLLTGRGNFGGR